MKIKKFKFKQILKLHLLKSRVYENFAKKNNLSFINDTNLTQTIINFKKMLQIIFKYHQIDKKILFIGLPKKLELKVNKLTNHVAVPAYFDLQGIILNTNFANLKINKNNKDYFSKSFSKLLLPKLLKQPDLVVFIQSDKVQTIISESYIAKVPLIIFDNSSSLKNIWLSNAYNVQGIGNNLSADNKNIFFVGLNFLFKTKNRNKNDLNKRINKRLEPNFRSLKKRFKSKY